MLKNRWLELSDYFRRVVLHGVTDEEQLKEICFKYAKRIFKERFDRLANMHDFDGYKKLEHEIKAFISFSIIEMIRWARMPDENFENLDLEEARKRYIEYLNKQRKKKLAVQF